MIKMISILVISFLLISCQGSSSSSDDSSAQTTESGTPDTGTDDPVVDHPVDPTDPTDPVVDTPDTGDTTVPTLAQTFATNITLVNFTTAQETKYLQAIELVKEVVGTEAFRTKVLNHTYNGVKTYVDNGGFTNEEIYQKILEAAEDLQPSKNNTMDLEVELYTNSLTSTVGYTYSNSKRIWVNTKYFNSYGVTSVANNLFHEWLHKIGFDHASSYSTSRDYSVPYAIGDIMEAVAKTI